MSPYWCAWLNSVATLSPLLNWLLNLVPLSLTKHTAGKIPLPYQVPRRPCFRRRRYQPRLVVSTVLTQRTVNHTTEAGLGGLGGHVAVLVRHCTA
jgi:hypothetical protein